jgi:hypothetical protein
LFAVGQQFGCVAQIRSLGRTIEVIEAFDGMTVAVRRNHFGSDACWLLRPLTERQPRPPAGNITHGKSINSLIEGLGNLRIGDRECRSDPLIAF